MGATQLSDDEIQKWKHHPDRPGKVPRRTVRDLFSLPDNAGGAGGNLQRNISKQVPTALKKTIEIQDKLMAFTQKLKGKL